MAMILAMDLLIGSVYAYHVDFGTPPFVVAASALFVAAIVTVATQVYQISVSNPVNALRDE